MATTIEKALKAAMSGPEVKDLNVFGHDWNVKKATVTKSGDTITVEGQISHNVAWSSDDQIYYEFVFKKNKLVKNNIKIDEKGWASIAGKIIGVISGGIIPAADVESLANRIENMAHGEWQMAGQQLALRIGLEGYKRKSKSAVAAKKGRKSKSAEAA